MNFKDFRFQRETRSEEIYDSNYSFIAKSSNHIVSYDLIWLQHKKILIFLSTSTKMSL